MSLTATLLHNHPITLPKGRRRTHHIEPLRPSSPPAKSWQEKGTADKNVELTFAAIVAGRKTVADIRADVGLGKATILRAVTQLEAWPDGPRIERDRSRRPHTFTPTNA